MSTNEMTSKIHELKELTTMKDELEAMIAALQDEIKAEMTARNTEEMTVDMFKIRYTTVKSSRFDTIAFKKAMPELAEQYTKQMTTRRFSIA